MTVRGSHTFSYCRLVWRAYWGTFLGLPGRLLVVVVDINQLIEVRALCGPPGRRMRVCLPGVGQ